MFEGENFNKIKNNNPSTKRNINSKLLNNNFN